LPNRELEEITIEDPEDHKPATRHRVVDSLGKLFRSGVISELDFARLRWGAPPPWRSGPGPEDGFVGNELKGVVERENDAAEWCGVGPSIAMRPVKYTHAIALTDGLEARDWRARRLKYKRIASTAIVDDHAATSAVVEPLDASNEIVVPGHQSRG
jgi:hypothetical protein